MLKEVPVPKPNKENEGMVKLLCYYKSIFRTPENLNHYSESDLRAAEKKFIKYVLLGHERQRSTLRFRQ
jgi:hypothetical protein